MSSLDKTLSTIVEISKLVTSSNDFFNIKDLVIDKMLEIVPPKRACVNVFKKDSNEYAYLVCKATLGNLPRYVDGEQTQDGMKISIDTFPKYIEDAIKYKRIYYIKDIFKDDRAIKERSLAKLTGYIGRIVVPLISGDKVKGFMTCFLEEGEFLSKEDIRFIDSVASLLALSVDITNRNKDIDEIIKKLREAIKSVENISDRLYESKELDSYFERIVVDVCNVTNSKSSLIFVKDDNYDIRIVKKYGQIRQIRQIAHFVNKKSISNPNIRIYKRQELPYELIEIGIKSLAYENLIKDDRSIGKIVLLNSERYYGDDLSIMGIFATQIILAVHLYINNRKILEDSIIHRDLEIVNQQQKLIMEDEIMIEDDFLQIDYLNIPYKYVGGDFCKFKKVADKKYILFIADVMGHGIMSNYFVAMMKGALNLLLTITSSPANILSKLNRILFNELDKVDVFITAKMIFFDFSKNIAYSSNAGHTVPIIIYKDEQGNRRYRLVKNNTAIALGILENSIYREEVLNINDVELFAIYTDGIIESKDQSGKEYGVENLAKYLIDMLNKKEEEICAYIPKELEKFTGKKKLEDDLTIFTIKKK